MKFIVAHLDNTGRSPSTGLDDHYYIVTAKDKDEALTIAAKHIFKTDENVSDGRELADVIDAVLHADNLGVWEAHAVTAEL